MPIIELDTLIAFVNPEDELHDIADRLIKNVVNGKLKNIKVATSALLEYELVLRSRGYSEREIREDIDAFRNLLREEPITGNVIVKASELREKYGLTYFDSLHAATAMLADGVIISSDKDYEKIPELKAIKQIDFLRD